MDIGAVKYLIYRDGRMYGATSETHWLDDVVPPGDHTYEVFTSREDATDQRSEGASVTVTMTVAKPPKSKVRIEGAFVTRVTVDGSTGGWAQLRGWKGYWTFRPRCAHGSCTTDLEIDASRSNIDVPLRFVGGAYRGSARDPSSACPDDGAPSEVSVVVRVTGVGASEGEWGADAFEGTIRFSFPSGTACGQEWWSGTARGNVLTPAEVEGG